MRSFQYVMMACLLLLLGCQGPQQAHSAEFTALFRSEEAPGFRGYRPGDPLAKVLEQEEGAARTADAYGLVYEIILGEEKTARIDYMSREGGTPRRLSAIVVQVKTPEEAAASELYTEIEAFLRGRHGVPNGSFGQYRWRDEESELEVELRMLSDKKSFSLNFAGLVQL